MRANLVDVVAGRVFYGELCHAGGRIVAVEELGAQRHGAPYLLPGFVDAHVHIESSLLMPDEFALAALAHGTLAAVSDPHEIANVLGIDGIELMRRRAALTPFRFLFGAPACVPATRFETAGASLDATAVAALLQRGGAGYLAEVMNFPGVLARDPDIMAKIAAARRCGVPVDGHAPGLRGAALRDYAAAGIGTDHEATTLAEARDKLAAGMSILIREGSAARDFAALHPLLALAPERVMLCSDDKHPDDLLEGHIRELVVRALALGHPLIAVLRAASLNPVRHYRLPLGLLQLGDSFDALLVRDLEHFAVETAWLGGAVVVEQGSCLLPHHPPELLNRFRTEPVTAEQLRIADPGRPCRVILARDGQLLTGQGTAHMPRRGGQLVADTGRDLLFLAVVNRYEPAPPALAIIQGFGLRAGAIAGSVAHDSHNIVAVGTSPEWLAGAVNAVIASRGGLVAVDAAGMVALPLPVAGLMSDRPARVVGPAYRSLNHKARQMGSGLQAPFMTLSFMALLVIPELKLSVRGLFDVNRFALCDVAVDDSA